MVSFCYPWPGLLRTLARIRVETTTSTFSYQSYESLQHLRA